MRPVVTAELVSSDKACPAALVGAGEWPRPCVVTKVSLQVVPLGEGLRLIKFICSFYDELTAYLPTVLHVTDVTVRFWIFLKHRKIERLRE